MNGVAKQFWSEVFDLNSPVDDDGGSGGNRGRRVRTRKKRVRRTAARQTPRQDASAA